MPSNNNPLPVSLQQECRKAQKIFSSFVDPNNGLDNIVPPTILRKAKGFAFITIVKAGFVFSARAGTGIVIARIGPKGSNKWSAPTAIGTAGVGAGFQAGMEITEFMIILNSSAAVKSFMAKGSLTVGGNMSISAGPLGRNVEGTGSLSAKGGISAMYSYSRSKGLFGGASIEGSIIVERSDANRLAYGYNVTAKQLLSGAVDLPHWCEGLVETLERRSGKDNRIDGWIEDGDQIDRRRSRREGDYDSDDDDEDDGREVFKDDGLSPREYEERGYSFSGQYASGGSTPNMSGGGRNRSGSGTSSMRMGGGESPMRSESRGGGGKFGNMLGSIGRSRSGSGASSTIGKQQRDSYSARDTSTLSGGGGGPISGTTANFSTKFDSDFDFEDRHQLDRPSLSSSKPPTNRSIDLIDAEDPFSESSGNVIDPSPSSSTTTTTSTNRPGLGRRVSSKLTKSRSGSGTGNALRERVGQMNWNTFENEEEQRRDPSRDSFDSLDDNAHDEDDDDRGTGRKRASTISGTTNYSSSNPQDTLSSYHRAPLPSSSSTKSKPPTTRTRSFTSPLGGGGNPFSFSRKNSSSKPSTPTFERHQSSLYPIRSNDSSSNVSDGFSDLDDPNDKRRGGGGSGGNPKPWDSEDESFINSSIPSQQSRLESQTSATGEGGAFDFNQVEADFASVMDGKGLTGSETRRNRSGTITDTSSQQGRDRSGTVTKSNGNERREVGALGKAVALYDFKGVESTDLSFSKHDVLTILNTDDEEWYKARLKLKEGMIPRNYVDIEWY